MQRGAPWNSRNASVMIVTLEHRKILQRNHPHFSCQLHGRPSNGPSQPERHRQLGQECQEQVLHHGGQVQVSSPFFIQGQSRELHGASVSLFSCPTTGWGFPSTGESEMTITCLSSKVWSKTYIENCESRPHFEQPPPKLSLNEIILFPQFCPAIRNHLRLQRAAGVGS